MPGPSENMPLMSWVYEFGGATAEAAWLRDRHMPLTKRERWVLLRMIAIEAAPEGDYGADLIFSKGGGWWLALDRVSAKVAWSLVRRAYVTLELGTSHADDYRSYTINADGRNAVQDEKAKETADE